MLKGGGSSLVVFIGPGDGQSPPRQRWEYGSVCILAREVDRADEDGQQGGRSCRKGHVDTARLLLDKGAEVDRAEKHGATPLLVACYEGHVDAARLCLDSGADINLGWTPLFAACRKGHVDAARLLLDRGGGRSGGEERCGAAARRVLRRSRRHGAAVIR